VEHKKEKDGEAVFRWQLRRTLGAAENIYHKKS